MFYVIVHQRPQANCLKSNWILANTLHLKSSVSQEYGRISSYRHKFLTLSQFLFTIVEVGAKNLY